MQCGPAYGFLENCVLTRRCVHRQGGVGEEGGARVGYNRDTYMRKAVRGKPPGEGERGSIGDAHLARGVYLKAERPAVECAGAGPPVLPVSRRALS